MRAGAGRVRSKLQVNAVEASGPWGEGRSWELAG